MARAARPLQSMLNMPQVGQNMPQVGQNMPMMPGGQNMPPYNPGVRPSYIPPALVQPGPNMPPNQISPPTKRQTKIDKAKFPVARTGWEDFKQLIGGSPELFQQFSRMSPQQQSVMQYLMNLGVFGLENPQSQYEGFAPIAQQATNQFYQQTVPTLAERFTSMGNGALSSPAFASQLGQAGAGLQSDLAAQQAQYGQQNMGNIMQMLQLGLNPHAENIHRPAQSGLGGKGLDAFVKMLPMLMMAA